MIKYLNHLITTVLKKIKKKEREKESDSHDIVGEKKKIKDKTASGCVH